MSWLWHVWQARPEAGKMKRSARLFAIAEHLRGRRTGTTVEQLAALSSSQQRQLLDHMESLKFIGVPARTAAPGVRRALEEAWFADAPLRIRYAGASETTNRRIRVRSVDMERTETLVNALDLDKNEQRQF